MTYQKRYGSIAIAAVLGLALMGNAAAAAREMDGAEIAQFEQRYLKFVIDHHFGALRMTELAAGTNVHRSAAILPNEGTSPTVNFRTTVAKAALDDIKSMARKDNRVQREEILAAQRMLLKWYGIRHAPRLSTASQDMIALLERTPPGAQFDKAYLRHMSHHHHEVLAPSVDCVVGASLSHGELKRYCKGIVDAQMMEIDEMGHLLCERYSDCHWQPVRPHAAGAAMPSTLHPDR